EQARARARELESTLPVDSLGRLQDHAHERDQLQSEIGGAKAAADRLLDLARRREAVLLPRRALAALVDVAAEREGKALHVDRVWIDTGAPDQHGVMQLTLQAATDFDATLGDRLQRALRAEFPDVSVRGPDKS